MLQMVRNMMLAAGAMALLNSCSNLDMKGLLMPTGAGVEKRFEQSMEMTSGEAAALLQTQEKYAFYVCTDPHINKTHNNLDIFNDALHNDAEASFGIILGDCIDVRDNLQTYLEAFACSEEKHPYNQKIFHNLGNHDAYFNGWENYRKLIGPSVYWFEAQFASGKDIYISLDTATGTLGNGQTIWLKSFLTEKRREYRHCIISTHTNLFYTDNSQNSSGNIPIEETLGLIDLLGRHDVTLVLQGHDHYREDLNCNGVRYTVVGTIRDEAADPEYLKVKVKPDGITYEWVRL